MSTAEAIAAAIGIYVLLGLLVSVWFVVLRLETFDPAARRTGLAFRLLILPGLAALWPLVLSRWSMRLRP